MNLETKIALQNTVWERFQIPIPDLELLLKDYKKHISDSLPQSTSEIADFLDSDFRKYLEPISGFFRSKHYRLSEIENAGMILESAKAYPWLFKDNKHGFYWSEFEIRMLTFEYKLHGERPLD
jgi:hypothetical protein